MNPTPEALILGGGPAGAAAARLLGRWGLEVVVVERSPGSDAGGGQSLAESLPPSTRKVLAATGLLGVVEAAGFQPNGGNTALWGGEGRRDDFAGGATGFHVQRARFDELLREFAAAGGAEIVKGVARLPERTAEGEGWRVEVVLDGGTRAVLRPAWILDCTGRAGVLARRHRILETAAPTLAVIRRYEHETGWSNVDPAHALVESFSRGWAWSVPTTDRERHVAVMLDPELHAVMESAPDLTAAFNAEIAATSLMRSVTTPARAVGDAWAVTASMYTSSTFALDHALLVGDAASFVDPMSSYGVKKALASAWLAAVTVNTAVRTPELTATALEFFRRREREMYLALRGGLAPHVAGTGAHLAGAETHVADTGAQAADTGAQAGGTGAQSADTVQATPGSEGDSFWNRRAEWLADQPDSSPDPNAPDGPDADTLRDDPEVRDAFHALRLGSGRLRTGRHHTVDRPLVIGNRIRMAPALVTPRFPDGVRYFRDVDLLRVVHLATGSGNPGALYESYADWAAREDLPPVDLANFIGVVALLVADGVLVPGPSR